MVDITDSFSVRLRAHLTDNYPARTWIGATLMYNSRTCKFYAYDTKEGRINLCVRTAQADYYFVLKARRNVADYTLLTPANPLPASGSVMTDLEIEAFDYPFTKGFTFLPRFNRK